VRVEHHRGHDARIAAGNKKYFALAKEQVEGPIQAACLVGAAGSLAQVMRTRNNFWLLVLTAAELRLFALRWGGWNRNAIDAELICVPLNAVERVEHRHSINPMVKACRLIFPDGDQRESNPV